MEDLKKDIENSKWELYEAYKEYKDIKHKYRNMSNASDKTDVAEAHKKMSEALENILDYIEDLFRDLYSCSECEEERDELKKSIKSMVIEYGIV